ncbi:MAG: protein tyrosine phosphatase, partial [Thermoprotei archaeon]
MALYVFVDDSVALGPMPSPKDLEELSKIFRATVVLVEEHELQYDVDGW